MFLESIDAHLNAIEPALDANIDYKSSTQNVTTKFALRISDEPDHHLTFDILNGGTRVYSYSSSDSDNAFSLSATREQWNQFFQPVPQPPYQSYWGMLRTIGADHGVRTEGNMAALARYARTWRLALDVIRSTIAPTGARSTSKQYDVSPTEDDGAEELTGTYLPTSTPLFGHSRVFTERAGRGPQKVLFLHTAGADSRQSHAIMRRKDMQTRYTMAAFDLPGHGRSELGTRQIVGSLTLDEDNYIAIISQVVQRLGWTKVIVAGASMAGQICLALGIRAGKEECKDWLLGTIACEACAHIPSLPPIYNVHSGADESMLNPETVCGMMSPSSPEQYKREVWWGYSSQGAGVFKGDLKFYFSGWDGRSRLKEQGVGCPVVMLTGEYDYSCTPAMSKETYETIAQKGKMSRFETMKGLGHFPLSEHPDMFVPWFDEAAKWIMERSGGG